MHIWLLTHPEELKKRNGTGNLIAENLPNQCTRLVWERTNPPQELISLSKQETLLVYPTTEAEKQTVHGKIESVAHVIILDGTWQQARKMYNRSPYLHEIQKYEIVGQTSIFKRRRNQLENGLCTAETAVHLLNKFDNSRIGEKLYLAFQSFNELD